jgi:hypothetical protein
MVLTAIGVLCGNNVYTGGLTLHIVDGKYHWAV